MKLLLHILLLMLLALPLFAQEDDEAEELFAAKVTVEKIDRDTQMSKSPMGAVWRSLAFPGWGQYYVEHYWKIPIFTGAAGTILYFIFDNNAKLSDKQEQLDGMEEGDPNYSTVLSQRDYYLDNRDMSIFYLAGVYIIAAIDAYVGAHLYDFNVNEDISLFLRPSSLSILNAGIEIKF